MYEKEEIIGLRRKHHDLEKRLEEFGNQRSTIVRLSEELRELMQNIESTQEKAKNLWNPAASTRMKMAKREIKLFKDLNYFDAELARELEKGNVSKDIVKKFVSVIVLIRQGKIPPAKKEFGFFEEIIEASREFEMAKEELEKKDRNLQREQHKIQKLLSDMSDLEKEKVDMGKVRSYEELLENLEALNKLREEHLRSFGSKPLAELLIDVGEHPQKDQMPGFPGTDGIRELKDFFSAYPALGASNAAEVCELFTHSEKKLSHICPETSKFRRIVSSRRKWFEALKSLSHTSFLAVDEDNDEAIDFFAQNVDGAKKIIERIRILRKEKKSCKEEFEKNKRKEERKRELSGYSREKLENELEDANSLLALLHSEQEEKEAEHGLISRIKSFFS